MVEYDPENPDVTYPPDYLINGSGKGGKGKGGPPGGALNCWNWCNEMDGPCDWCGNVKLCCRKGWIGNGCDGSIGDTNQHQCVLNPASPGGSGGPPILGGSGSPPGSGKGGKGKGGKGKGGEGGEPGGPGSGKGGGKNGGNGVSGYGKGGKGKGGEGGEPMLGGSGGPPMLGESGSPPGSGKGGKGGELG